MSVIASLKIKEETVMRRGMVNVKWCLEVMNKFNIRMRMKPDYRDLRSRICGNEDSEYKYISRNISVKRKKESERGNPHHGRDFLR